MRKIAFAALIFPLLLAPMGHILAQEAASSAETVKDAFVLPKTFFGDFINKWFGKGKLKDTVQQGMNEAQTEIQEAAGQALGSAQDAIADEINQQINQAIQGAKHKVEGYVNGVVAMVKAAVNNFISKIKLFFVDLFI